MNQMKGTATNEQNDLLIKELTVDEGSRITKNQIEVPPCSRCSQFPQFSKEKINLMRELVKFMEDNETKQVTELPNVKKTVVSKMKVPIVPGSTGYVESKYLKSVKKTLKKDPREMARTITKAVIPIENWSKIIAMEKDQTTKFPTDILDDIRECVNSKVPKALELDRKTFKEYITVMINEVKESEHEHLPKDNKSGSKLQFLETFGGTEEDSFSSIGIDPNGWDINHKIDMIDIGNEIDEEFEEENEFEFNEKEDERLLKEMQGSYLLQEKKIRDERERKKREEQEVMEREYRAREKRERVERDDRERKKQEKQEREIQERSRNEKQEAEREQKERDGREIEEQEIRKQQRKKRENRARMVEKLEKQEKEALQKKESEMMERKIKKVEERENMIREERENMISEEGENMIREERENIIREEQKRVQKEERERKKREDQDKKGAEEREKKKRDEREKKKKEHRAKSKRDSQKRKKSDERESREDINRSERKRQRGQREKEKQASMKISSRSRS